MTGTSRSLAGTRFLEMPKARKLSANAEYAGKMGTQDQIWTRHRVAAMRLTTDGRAKPGQGEPSVLKCRCSEKEKVSC